MGDAGDEGGSVLIDVSDVSLRDIESLDETVLRGALRQVLEEATGSPDAAAGFNAFIPPAADERR